MISARVALGMLVVAGSSSLAGGVAVAQESAAQPAPATDASRVVGPPRSRPLAGDALLDRTEEVGELLRCPVCQGLSVADSPATMAVNMKAQVKEMLAAGYDEEQILAYFEGSYGEFVRLEPPLRGVNWLVWLAPLLGLAAGAAVVIRFLRSPARAAKAPSPDEGAPGPDTLPDDPRLAHEVLRVRELAYGWPGGRQPGRAPKTAPEAR